MWILVIGSQWVLGAFTPVLFRVDRGLGSLGVDLKTWWKRGFCVSGETVIGAPLVLLNSKLFLLSCVAASILKVKQCG